MHEDSDAELVERVKGGAKDAFGQLAERYRRMVERLAMGMVGNVFLAQELTQEALLAAYLSLAQLRDGERFKSWLYGITLNICRNYLRTAKADVYSLEALVGGMHGDPGDLASYLHEGPDPQAVAEERELAALVLRSVRALPSGEREAVLLFYYEQFSVREIADMLDISIVAVKGRLHKARRQLRERLQILYDETPVYSIQRSRSMVKVTIVDAITLLKEGSSTVVLTDESGRRVLGIWIGKAEAAAISLGLEKTSTPRPMTMQFMASILEATGATLEEVRIDRLKDEIFYATMRLRFGGILKEIDARPSDALALAVVTGSPVYVAAEIMEQCAIDVPEGKQLRPLSARAQEVDISKAEAGYVKDLTKEDYEEQFRRVLGILLK